MTKIYLLKNTNKTKKKQKRTSSISPIHQVRLHVIQVSYIRERYPRGNHACSAEENICENERMREQWWVNLCAAIHHIVTIMIEKCGSVRCLMTLAYSIDVIDHQLTAVLLAKLSPFDLPDFTINWIIVIMVNKASYSSSLTVLSSLLMLASFNDWTWWSLYTWDTLCKLVDDIWY